MHCKCTCTCQITTVEQGAVLDPFPAETHARTSLVALLTLLKILSAGKDFRDGAVVPFELVWMSCASFLIVMLGVAPFTFLFGCKEGR